VSGETWFANTDEHRPLALLDSAAERVPLSTSKMAAYFRIPFPPLLLPFTQDFVRPLHGERYTRFARPSVGRAEYRTGHPAYLNSGNNGNRGSASRIGIAGLNRN
jgi:hypothetical protein